MTQIISAGNMRFPSKSYTYDGHNRPPYDTKEGIQQSLLSYRSFLKLLSERRKAGYERDESLNDFYVLGLFYLDSCGNVGLINEGKVRQQFPEIPDVLADGELSKFLNGKSVMISFSLHLPNEHTECARCKGGWDMANIHDIVAYTKREVFSLEEYVGKTLIEVQIAYAQKNEAVYFMQNDIIIRNDRFITEENKTGWVDENFGITDNYVIQAGDEGFFNVRTFYHKDCNRMHIEDITQQYYTKLFQDAGFTVNILQLIPNQYCPCEICTPWAKVTTEFGSFTIGWRKRVINIDCEKLGPKIDLTPLVKKDDVTGSKTHIHAWGDEKAEEYLRFIFQQLSA